MPILVVTIALVCCCFVTGNGIKGSDHVCQDLEMEKKPSIRRKGTRYVRRITTFKSDKGQMSAVGSQVRGIKRDGDNLEMGGKNPNTSGKISDRLETDAPMFTEPASA